MQFFEKNLISELPARESDLTLSGVASVQFDWTFEKLNLSFESVRCHLLRMKLCIRGIPLT